MHINSKHRHDINYVKCVCLFEHAWPSVFIYLFFMQIVAKTFSLIIYGGQTIVHHEVHYISSFSLSSHYSYFISFFLL